MPEEKRHYLPSLETRTRYNIRVPVFVTSALIAILFITIGLLFLDNIASGLEALQNQIAVSLGWFYTLTMTIFLLLTLWLAFGKYGGVRLGPDYSRPDYSYVAWFAMLFSAGMGIGLLFFAVAEPIHHFSIDVPPASGADPGSPQAASDAMNITFFHWGLHAWGVYILLALALSYFAYRVGLPLSLRSTLYPLIGERYRGWLGDMVDVIAIVGTLFGVATSLGLGAIQINAGLTYVAGIEASLTLQLAIIAVISVLAAISVVLGVDAGIRRISFTNMVLVFILAAFILAVGPTAFLLQSIIESIGYYAQNLVQTSTRTDAFVDPDWQQDWTLFYWGWWISWSPFVAMFIARISRGRTIREFVTGVLLVPTAMTFVVLTIFGKMGIYIDMFGDGGVADATSNELEFALFAMLEHLPWTAALSILAMVVIAIFFVTSSDSGSLVKDILASGGDLRPVWQTRLFWASTEGIIASVLLIAGGATALAAFQQAAIAMGVPLALLLLVICYSLWLALRTEPLDREVTQNTTVKEQVERHRHSQR
ncbi:MAG: BCCT family transporter [Sphaerobacteraceae bacterium]|nr:MAG: BCCT family transporter [Sphaerobacteraceae bacterium]